MPRAPRRACRAGCPHFQPCPIHTRRQWTSSAAASSAARGYGAAHRALRRQVLREEPICQACRFRLSTTADHVVPLSRGGQTVRENLQGLCDKCSRAKTGREGQGARAISSGFVAGLKQGGSPVPQARPGRDWPPP
jgi:5-methylcytosine-specific restriction protein A